MYTFYIGDIMLPVTPESLQISSDAISTTFNLMNGQEIYIPGGTKLRRFSFSALLPNVLYHFANYVDGFHVANYYINKFRDMQAKDKDGNIKPFQFIVTRALPNGKGIGNINYKTVFDGYKVTRNAANGFDDVADIKLVQYVEPKRWKK